MLPPALAELPEEPNRNVDDLAYAYWLGFIYRCECLLHEESSRMVYGAFPELVMRRSYQELIKSPLGQYDLEKIWPAKENRHKQRQAKELSRAKNSSGRRLEDGVRSSLPG